MPNRSFGQRKHRGGLLTAIVVICVLLLCSRYIASTLIDYSWWSSVGHLGTWINLWLYRTLPVAIAAILFFVTFWIAFKRGIRRELETPHFGFLHHAVFTRIATAVLALIAIAAANATVNSWTVVRFFGGVQVPVSKSEYVDPIFHKTLHFYFFSLPFYNLLLHMVLTGAILALILYWVSANVENIARHLIPVYPRTRFEFEELSFGNVLRTRFVRLAGVIFLIGLAVKLYFNRFNLLFVDHGPFLVGVNWVSAHVTLPLIWLMIFGAVAAAVLVMTRYARWALVLLIILPIRFILPSIVEAVYVHPNELALERPYIQEHIDGTRSAYGLTGHITERTFEAVPEMPLDYAKHKNLLDNVRLWDWRAFHDTIAQIQPLRPYIYIDTDVDRYMIDGELRQVMISPRELDMSQLGSAADNWVNPHLMYTHGYGLVMAEANRITADGLPQLFIKDAPVEVTTKSLQVTRPEIYYGENTPDSPPVEPIFVDTKQPEFNYPSGSQSVYTEHKGTGGIKVSPLLRLAAAIKYGDPNIVLTDYLTRQSRMMIHRTITNRLHTLAGFLRLDPDPYMVVTKSGHLVWMIDCYMTSDSHPFSRGTYLGYNHRINYIRNSIKATVDAYTGEVNLYVFDPSDVLVQAYWKLFPHLFKPESAMPPDLRAHARYPEALFSIEANIYRTYHMRDPEAFYNRADLWDIAKVATSPNGPGSLLQPTYVVATLPDDNQPEFMLIIPFTPAHKDNLIAYMAARCDGSHLGQIVVEQLSKKNIIFGPRQIEARINQDRNIAKDLALWNQQGSRVLRGQILVLPIDNSFLYIQPIYIQAAQASMPQLRKVALAMGNRLVFADTYEQALTNLIASLKGEAPAKQTGAPAPVQVETVKTAAQPPASAQAVKTLTQIRDHLEQYRKFSAQGKWAEAGKELDAIQKLVQK
ncbi:MAG: UPF0182 family protein [Bryobacteraceae bacterium]